VTKEDVQRVAQKYFGANNRTVATLLRENEEKGKTMRNLKNVGKLFCALVRWALSIAAVSSAQTLKLPPHEKLF